MSQKLWEKEMNTFKTTILNENSLINEEAKIDCINLKEEIKNNDVAKEDRFLSLEFKISEIAQKAMDYGEEFGHLKRMIESQKIEQENRFFEKLGQYDDKLDNFITSTEGKALSLQSEIEKDILKLNENLSSSIANLDLKQRGTKYFYNHIYIYRVHMNKALYELGKIPPYGGIYILFYKNKSNQLKKKKSQKYFLFIQKKTLRRFRVYGVIFQVQHKVLWIKLMI